MNREYVKLCPACHQENAPQNLRCRCGVLLTGVDLTEKRPAGETPASAGVSSASDPVLVSADEASAGASLLCPYEDCGQPNPAGSQTCLYCNRPLAGQHPGHKDEEDALEIRSLLNLPLSLRDRFDLLYPMAATGAEADLLMLKRRSDQKTCVLKLYRHGIRIKTPVLERLKKIPAAHHVEMIETGTEDGHYYEILEYCEHGSLRQLLQKEKPDLSLVEEIVHELSIAIASVHEAGLLHRDLKPENVLVRSLQPLDLVLTDFGISSVMDATQRLTGAARTLYYAPPESLSGVIDCKADYWALGMMTLEALLGRHPFSGLSEAVTLHYLTTREVDLSGIADKRFLKLLRGLLMRDPKQRWSDAEIQRWLAHDASLPEPAVTSGLISFKEPYHLGDDVCHTKEQLGVALSRHWQEGVHDIISGQLLAWFRDVQKDQNAVRLLLAMRHEAQLSADIQLLRLMLYLSPGLPPVWKGQSIELQQILRCANRALKGGEEAAAWLHQLYVQGVLEIYRDAGDEACAGVVRKWTVEAGEFRSSWKSAQELLKAKSAAQTPGEYVNMDQLLYGADVFKTPPLVRVHAQLLALSYDPAWAARLRRHLQNSYNGLMAYCPWLGELGQIADMSPSMLLVMDAMLPEARAAADKQQKHEAQKKETAKEDFFRLKKQLATETARIRTASSRQLLMRDAVDDLKGKLDQLFTLLTDIRSHGEVDEQWMDLKKQAVKAERICVRMNHLADEIEERTLRNQGWLGQEVLGAVVLLLFTIPIFLRRSVLAEILLLVAAVIAWRVLPIYLNIRKLRSLAAML